MSHLHIIMPVKDSLDTTREAIRCLYQSSHTDWSFTVYNDFSSDESTAELLRLSKQYGFTLHNWAEHTDHPSPNYRFTLQDAQRKAIAAQADLMIIESDVMVQPDTIERMMETSQPVNQSTSQPVGMVAAVTHDSNGHVNFPYEYAKSWTGQVNTKKRFSFCCTLLRLDFLQAFSFENLNPEKNWYDVTISHQSVEMGFQNILLMDSPVLHKPHSSRPWKLLKYSNPLKYYLQKIFLRRDKI